MGQSAADTVRDIEETRGRLDEELRELESRLPGAATWKKRLAGIAVGGGVAAIALWLAYRRLLSGRRSGKQDAGAGPMRFVVELRPEQAA